MTTGTTDGAENRRVTGPREGRRIRLAATLGLTWLILLPGCAPRPPPPPKEVAAAVEVVSPAAAASATDIVATGVVERQHQVDLAFRVSGQISELNANEGEAVGRGQAIARVDPTNLQLRLNEARSEETILRRDLARYETLSVKGFVAQQKLDYLRATADHAHAAVETAALQLQWTQLISPVRGVVLKRLKQRGDIAQAGETILEVADSASPLMLRAAVPASALKEIRVGQAAFVTSNALPGARLTGAVVRLGAEADRRTGTVDVQIRLPETSGLQSGAYASVLLPRTSTAPLSDLQRLPAETLLKATGDRAEVYVVDPHTSRARRTTIRFGGFDGDAILVAGLPPTARVISGGAGFITDGALVRPAAAPASEVRPAA